MGEWVRYNPNPFGRNVGDCTIRALSKALDKGWDEVYAALAIRGYMMGDMPSANYVWGAYLEDCGFVRDLAPAGETVREFVAAHPRGTYVLALSGHVVCAQDGVIYDSWDSGNEIVLYFWHREDF